MTRFEIILVFAKIWDTPLRATLLLLISKSDYILLLLMKKNKFIFSKHIVLLLLPQCRNTPHIEATNDKIRLRRQILKFKPVSSSFLICFLSKVAHYVVWRLGVWTALPRLFAPDEVFKTDYRFLSFNCVLRISFFL